MLGGAEIGCSLWVKISQQMINSFADLTDDHQFIHTDSARSQAETEFNGTIAHGFLTLSLLTRLMEEACPRIQGLTTSINYGFDKIRFISPLPSDGLIRGCFLLKSLDEIAPNEVTLHYHVRVDLKNSNRPVLIAEWLVRQLFKDDII